MKTFVLKHLLRHGREKYIADFSNDNKILPSWYRQYKAAYVGSHPQDVYVFMDVHQHPLIQMVTSNRNDLIDLIVLIYNTQQQKKELINSITDSIRLMMGQLIEQNNKDQDKIRNAQHAVNKFFISKFGNNYDSYAKIGSFINQEYANYLRKYYSYPKLLALDPLPTYVNEVWSERKSKIASVEDRNLILEFFNFVYNNRLIPGKSSPIPTYDEIFNTPFRFDNDLLYEILSTPNHYIIQRSVYL